MFTRPDLEGNEKYFCEKFWVKILCENIFGKKKIVEKYLVGEKFWRKV